MAKACMDIEAKKNKDFLAQWDYMDIPKHLWPITPLSKMWGIGSRLEKRLNKMGFYCVGDIACSDPEFLKKKIGVIGEEIYYHSLGYDDALLQETYVANNHSLSVGQVLLRDYCDEEMPTVIRDMAIELSDRMFEEKVLANNFLLYIGNKDQGGFGKKIGFYTPTDSAEKIGREAVSKYMEHKELFQNENELFRQVMLVAVDVIPRDNYQPSLFEDYEEDCKLRNLEETLVEIRRRYGTLKAMPCSALSLSSTFITRSNQIGGHHA
jgi:DNA polymerase V